MKELYSELGDARDYERKLISMADAMIEKEQLAESRSPQKRKNANLIKLRDKREKGVEKGRERQRERVSTKLILPKIRLSLAAVEDSD